MILYIKRMYCHQCIVMVKEAIEKSGLAYSNVCLGEVHLLEMISQDQKNRLKDEIQKIGMELIDDKKAILIEQIKRIIIDLISRSDERLKINLSDFLSNKLHYNYTYLANLFSECEGVTIAHFVVTYKIEKAKELITYDKLSLTEISHRLHYSSVAHLSNQFKKVTGMTPTTFRSIIHKGKAKATHIIL